MGHYYSEMYSDDRTDEQKKEDAKYWRKREKLEKKMCELFECNKKDFKIIRDILKESFKL